MKLPFFNRKPEPEPFDREHLTPVIRCSICTGERVAGFLDRRTGRIREIMLIRNDADVRTFCERFGLSELPKNVY